MGNLIALGIMLGSLSMGAAPLLVEELVRRVRRRRLHHLRRPAGPTTTLEGWVRAPRLVLSPIGRMHCAVAYARIAAKASSLWRGARRVELQAGADFFLETDSGPVLVRASDVWIGEVGPPNGTLPDVDPRVAEVLRDAGLAVAAELVYHEAVIFPGDRVRVRGVLRDEPAPPSLAAHSGYRDAPIVRTLSGGGEAVQIEPVPLGRTSRSARGL